MNTIDIPPTKTIVIGVMFTNLAIERGHHLVGVGGPTSRSARVRGSSETLPQRLARVATTSQSRREAKCGEINNDTVDE